MESNYNFILFSQRLQFLIDTQDVSPKELHIATGISESQISKWLGGKQKKIKRDNARILVEHFKCELPWVERGEGEPYPPKTTATTTERSAYGYPIKETVLETDYTHIKLYEIEASAGHGANVDNELMIDVLAFKTAWIRNELRLDPAKLTLIFVTGDSMEPTLSAGDIILVDHAAVGSITEGIWVLSMGDGPIVKRVERLSRTELRISSDNKRYTPREISLENPPEGMKFIGRVVWSGRRM